MNRLFLTSLLSVALTVSALASEPMKTPEAAAPTQPAATAPEKSKEDKKADKKAARDEKKAEQMAEAAKKCSESIAKVEENSKAMADGEAKDMANLFIAHAKLEEGALQNKNMLSHWNRHQRKCTSYVRKAEAQVKKHSHEKKKEAAPTAEKK